MADVKMPESTPCIFDKGWGVKCGKPSTNGCCSEHEKLKCTCCGKKATRNCPETMGALCCGAPLCNECTHSPTGSSHVTQEVAEEQSKTILAEMEAVEASRTSPIQRIDDTGCPLNLFELLKGDESSYEIKPGFFAQLDHHLMGFFPAIFAEDRKRVVVTLSRELMIKVLETLPPRKFRIGENLFYVFKDHGVAYANIDDKESSTPDRYLTEEEFLKLTADGKKPFKWAPGLIGADMNEEEFLDSLKAVAAKVG